MEVSTQYLIAISCYVILGFLGHIFGFFKYKLYSFQKLRDVTT